MGDLAWDPAYQGSGSDSALVCLDIGTGGAVVSSEVVAREGSDDRHRCGHPLGGQ